MGRKKDAGFHAGRADDRHGHHRRPLLGGHPSYISAVKHAREAVLKEDLHVLRSAVDSYTMDKQKAPQSLDDLLQDGYLKKIPEDPMTRSTTTWVTNLSDSLHSLDQTDPGIDDVHSAPMRLAPTGSPILPGESGVWKVRFYRKSASF